MKSTRWALLIASLMAALTSALCISSMVRLQQQLSNLMAGWKEEGLDKMQAVQHEIDGFHHRLYWDLAYAAWYLILAGLLIFVVYRTRKLK